MFSRSLDIDAVKILIFQVKKISPPCQFLASLNSRRYHWILKRVVSATRRSRYIKIPLCLSAIRKVLTSEKFNLVSNYHGRTQKCDFCVSVCKTNFTDHRTPDTIHGCRDSVLVCKMHDCYCTIRKNFEHFHSLP